MRKDDDELQLFFRWFGDLIHAHHVTNADDLQHSHKVCMTPAELRFFLKGGRS